MTAGVCRARQASAKRTFAIYFVILLLKKGSLKDFWMGLRSTVFFLVHIPYLLVPQKQKVLQIHKST